MATRATSLRRRARRRLGETPDEAAKSAAAGDVSEASTNPAPAGSPRRTLAEAHSATAQWLAGIEDAPARFVTKRIIAESARRRLQNGALPEAADPW
jgi:hypothetical protein